MFFNLIIIVLASLHVQSNQDIELNGYILYCPCMGRFGNQAEQLLGTLQFAKSLNRTLVLPPFIEYNKTQVNFIPFESLIDLNQLKKFHKVIPIKNFMETVAHDIWKLEERPIFCYSKRPGKKDNDCNPCEGNPFESFWKQYNITFSSSVFYGPLSHNHKQAADWINEYSEYNVLTFTGAPSSFPVDGDAVKIQQYITLADEITQNSNYFKNKWNLEHPYIGVHLRWGSDWQRTCSLLEENQMKSLFSSAQCSDGKHVLPPQLCIQDINLILKTIKKTLSESVNISTVYIASDLDDQPAWQSIYNLIQVDYPSFKLFTPTNIYGNYTQNIGQATHFTIDLSILASSDIFIGNCISSFSAFVSRIRTLSIKKPSETTRFLGLEHTNSDTNHDEL